MRKFHIFPSQFGFFPYVFLLYFTMPIYYISFEKGWKAVLGYTLILLFIVSYRQLYWYSSLKKHSFWLVTQLSIMVTLIIWFNPYNLFLGFFPANFISWYEKKRQFYRAYLAFTIVLLGSTLFLTVKGTMGDVLFILPFLVVMLISPFGIRSMYRRMELEKQLDQANEQIKELVKREERTRIARDLHDTLGHTLSLITLQSQLVQKLVERHPERAEQEAKEIEAASRSALRQVRELVSGMRANTIAEELEYMKQIFMAAEIEFVQEGISDFSHIPPLEQNILAMCLRESGTNVVKHSGAKRCTVTIQKEKGIFSITVKDDGIGMAHPAKIGNGLRGMKERLSLLEGRLEWETDHGTAMKIIVPVVRKQEEIVI